MMRTVKRLMFLLAAALAGSWVYEYIKPLRNLAGKLEEARAASDPELERKAQAGELQKIYRFMTASAHGDLKQVDAMLGGGMDVDVRGDNRRTALMYASWNGQREVCDRLLKAGANIRLQDRDGNNAIAFAAGRGLIGMVQFLRARTQQGDERRDMEFAVLMHAAYAGDVGRLPDAKKPLVNLNRLNPEGQSPLHVAAGNGSSAVLAELIRRGGDVELKNADGQTPLHWAAWNNQPMTTGLLIERGAKLSAGNRGGVTPLMLAVESDAVEAVRVLLEHGADPHARDKEGRTAMSLAKEKKKSALVQLMEQAF